jgi:predicted small lipoprotein YifL
LGFVTRLRILRTITHPGMTMKNPLRKKIRSFTVPLLMAFLPIAGCGQFGDLYLPEPEEQPEVSPQDDTDAPDDAQSDRPEDL